MAFKVKRCRTCEAEFQPTGPFSFFCQEHSDWKKKPQSKNNKSYCRHCMSEFPASWGHRFCTPECKTEHRVLKAKEAKAWYQTKDTTDTAAVKQSRAAIKAYVQRLM